MLSNFLVPVWLSLKTASIATLITSALGVSIAWHMHQYQGKGKNIFDTLLTAPLVFPPTVVGFLLLLALGKNSWLGKILSALGIQIIFTWYGAVLAATIVAFPLMYRSALNAFEQIDSHLVECAQTLGATNRTIFWRIIIPLATPGLITGIILSLARALGEFGATLMVAGSIPGKTQTIPIAIYLAAESGNMLQAAGLVAILLAICLGLIFGLNNYQPPTKKPKKSLNKLQGYGPNVLASAEQNYLEVNIQKQLPNLLLKVAFNLDSSQSPLGIMGMSGAGKTTLLRCLAGLETPDYGFIKLNGKILFDSREQINILPQKRRISLVFQNYALFPHLSAAANIVFGLPQQLSHQALGQQLFQQLQNLELKSVKDCLPQTLSGGEQQRVALARALARQPHLTLLDEPLSALDNNLKNSLIQLLQTRLTQHHGLSIYVSHNLPELAQLCPQVLILDRGQAIAFGATTKIYQRPPNLGTAKLIGCHNFSSAQQKSPDTLFASDWQCNLQISQSFSGNLTHIGIHNHQLKLITDRTAPNTFPVWLVSYQSITSRIIVHLKLHNPPQNLGDFQLVAELTWKQWQLQKNVKVPWHIQLPPQHLIPFND